jgi:hypothetical protein
MYDQNFDFLKGQELAMLCFGPYTLTLHFDGGTQLQIEGEFAHVICKNKSKHKYRFPISGSELTTLLMETVSAIETTDNGRLTLHFSNGDVVVIKGRIGPYEAYNIQHQGKCFVV